ncbi:uncharacterized protein KY384_005529 [Bacidia gigantensis]|uniref:uncharacterized protein n=1 Tax=Bacidia gigantensis TaxID=2732470 RepID=UPI001D058B5D|nr:uncharacterized protein KY384_005529 [Bacidia gigantensis]KAG8530047.1 hypothetical protein KY384_005529 [Bacidia gigantensis]
MLRPRLMLQYLMCLLCLMNPIPAPRNIARGLLRSGKIVRYISDIPCDVIQTLENDANEAQDFVEDLKQGKVPTLIENLPNEVTGAFKDVLSLFVTLPSELVGAAEAAVTDAVHIFNDIETGAIVSDLEELPGVIVSDVTSAWGDLTSGLEDDWNAATHAIACFFGDCPTSTAATGTCQGQTEASATSEDGPSTETSVITSEVSIARSYYASATSVPPVATMGEATPVQTPNSVPAPTDTTHATGQASTLGSQTTGAPATSPSVPADSGSKGIDGATKAGAIAVLTLLCVAFWL